MVRFLFTLWVLFCFLKGYSQPGTYILNGSAQRNNCNCYTLTNPQQFQSGSVWNKNQINLTASFDFKFNVFLGCDATGADGIVFILQPISTSVGSSGEGMGFAGVSPSVGIPLDTYTNANQNDPYYDHIAIQVNGQINHNTDVVPPVQLSSTSSNVKDCKWHELRITWDAVSKSLTAYFDGQFRIQAKMDIVKDIFSNDPNVYWGFTGATGGSTNLQQFCTALNPKFTTNLPNNAACESAVVKFADQSTSFAAITNYYWNFGDGSASTSPNPPAHNYPTPGIYNIQMAITGKDGCNSDTLKTVVAIGSKPVANFSVFDSCIQAPPRIVDLSLNKTGAINKWNWTVDGARTYTDSIPQLTNLSVGMHSLQLGVTSEYGCTSGGMEKKFTVKARPLISAAIKDGCQNAASNFSASQKDAATTVAQWNWNFGDSLTATGSKVVHTYPDSNAYNVQAWAVATNGCSSDTVSKTITIYGSYAFAGRDTIILKNVPFQLNGQGTGAFEWTPPTGLSSSTIANPKVTLNDDQTYVLTTTTQQGCIAKDTLVLKVFKGSAVYVPTAFTPNNDGMNDILKPTFIAIRKLDYFIIFNRWGEKVFTTTTLTGGWNGTLRGGKAQPGAYVWVLRAVDVVGHEYNLKGSFVLIR